MDLINLIITPIMRFLYSRETKTLNLTKNNKNGRKLTDENFVQDSDCSKFFSLLNL